VTASSRVPLALAEHAHSVSGTGSRGALAPGRASCQWTWATVISATTQLGPGPGQLPTGGSQWATQCDFRATTQLASGGSLRQQAPARAGPGGTGSPWARASCHRQLEHATRVNARPLCGRAARAPCCKLSSQSSAFKLISARA
jgi:hypothetical protein